MQVKEIASIAWCYRSTLILILTPLLLLPLPLAIPSTEACCGYCILLMAVYWVTEVLPLAVTSFLPLVLFPLMGVMSASETSVVYLKDTCWLFLGGLLIAVAVEDTGLHKRIALRVLLWFGTTPQSLMLGFMVPTYFLSMWISNTATTAMMLPIVEAVLEQLTSGNVTKEIGVNEEENGEISTVYKPKKFSRNNLVGIATDDSLPPKYEFDNEGIELDETVSSDVPETEIVGSDDSETPDETKHKQSLMKKGLTICIPYAASIGGISTLTGTGPNLVLAGQFDKIYPDSAVSLSFGVWMAYNIVTSLTLLFLGYLWLVYLFLGFDRRMLRCLGQAKDTEADKRVRKVLLKEYEELSNIKWNELTVLCVFTTTALLWLFREPGFMPGWGHYFGEDEFVSDGTVAMTMAVTLFFLPANRPVFMGGDGPPGPVSPVLLWKTVHYKFPWSVLFLLGGGFALAKGAEVSGFSFWLGEQLTVLANIPNWVICLVVTIITSIFTECTSNVATASILVPVLAQMASSIRVHPIYILMPATIATSLSFMLPVATPPNAIAFSFGHLKVKDLVKAGWMMNVIGIITVNIYINTYGMALFNLGEFPEWAALPNTTDASLTTALPNVTTVA